MKNTKATRFCKITLFQIARKGKSADITISIPKKELRYWDEKTRQFVTPTGEYVFQVGGSSENISIEETIKISTVS